MTSNAQRSFFRSDIQALRGLAIILVLLFHLPHQVFKFGYLGVDVFFVISGYLITPRIFALFDETPNLAVLSKNLTKFALNRTQRLAPAFAVTVLIFLPLLLLLGDINLQNIILNQAIAGLFLLGNFGAYKFGGNYFHPGIGNPLLHFWSLSVEEQIYVFLPVALFTLYLVNRRWFKKTGRIFFLLLFIISVFFTFHEELLTSIYAQFFAVPSSFSFYSPITRFWEFAAGGLVAFTYRPQIKLYLSTFAKHLLNLLFFVSLIFTTSIRTSLILVIVVTTTCALIFTNSLEVLPQKAIRFLSYFGDRSYSLYLVHLPIFHIFILSPYAHVAFGDLSLFASLAALIASILLSDLLYRFVELRFHKIDGAHIARPNKKTHTKSLPILISSSIMLSLLSVPVVSSGFFGFLNSNSTNNPGLEFKQHCVRESPFRQFPCSFPGNDINGSIALVGDSHASQYSMMLWDLAKKGGFKLILVGDFGGEVNSLRAFESISSITPEFTIVSKYWNSEFLRENSKMISDLQEIRSLSKKLVIVGQNPIFVQEEIAPVVSLLQLLIGAKSVSESKVAIGRPTVESRIADGLIRVWAEKSRVDYLNSYRVLCPNLICEKAVGEKSLYIDSNHLSIFGAQMLRDDFSKILLLNN